MKKSDIPRSPTSHLSYFNQIEDIHFIEALENSLLEIQLAPIEKWKELGSKVYAPGKWTVNDILQHILDCERVFAYRVSAYARGEKKALLPFDEDEYAANAQANLRQMDEIIEELTLVRKSTIAMFKSFTPEMLLTPGTAYNGSEIYVLAMAYVLAGHQKWHFKVIEERYFALLEN